MNAVGDPMKNEAALTDAGPFEKMVAFEISSADLNHAMNRASRRISREVTIPGFRPGRAPRRLVERRVGAGRVRADALDDLVPARVGKILSQTEIAPVVPPLLESVTDSADGAVRVEVRVTTWPRLESPPSYQGMPVEVPEPAPVDGEVDTRIRHLRQMYAPLQTVDRATEPGDFVVIDMTVMEGERLIESLALDGFSYEVGTDRLTAEIDQSLLGREAGDEFELSAPLPGWLSTDPGEVDAGTDAEGSGDAGEVSRRGLYRIRVVDVQSRSLPDLDDEWASEYTGHDSLEELREEIRGEVEERFNSMQWETLVAETMKEAVAGLDLELPERLEAAQTEMLLRNHLTYLENIKSDYGSYLERIGLDHEQYIDRLREQAVAGLKARILIESVIDAEGLTVEDDEVVEALRAAVPSARDPERFGREVEAGVHTEQLRSDMLNTRAQAFLAMQVQPINDRGEPVTIEAPAAVRAWFEPGSEPAEIPDEGVDIGEALYEAEVIDDRYPD